jgi:hypothetical protein
MRLEYESDARVKKGINTLVKMLVKKSRWDKKAAKILAAHRTYYYLVGNCPTL